MALKNDNLSSNLDDTNSAKDKDKKNSAQNNPKSSQTNKSMNNNKSAKQSQTTVKADKDNVKQSQTIAKADKDNVKQSQTTVKAKTKNDKNNLANNSFITFLKEVKVEFRKISWPTRPQVIQETWSVLVLVTLVTLFVLGCDWVLAHAFFSPLDAWARIHGGGIGLK